MISCRQLAVRAHRRTILKDISFDISAGERIALAGPSGSGKTTLLRTLAGLQVLCDGSMQIGDETVSSNKNTQAPHLRGIAVVPQDLGLWPNLTVLGHLRLGGHPKDVAVQMLDKLNLTSLAKRKPAKLSGGERQRVALGIALMQQPKLLLLDEPFTALDLVLKQDLLTLVNELIDATHCALLCSTHDPYEALGLQATRLLVLDNGQLHVDTPWPSNERPLSDAPSMLHAWNVCARTGRGTKLSHHVADDLTSID